MSEVSLGAFILEDPIGAGGMGEVWRGRHGEVEAVAALDHPGVVLVFDHGEVDALQSAASGGTLQVGEPYLVTEFASGGSLDRRRRPRDWAELRALLLALLDALGHAHAHRVIHLDLKPGNLLHCTRADFRPGLKLTDFGLAQALDELHRQPHRKPAGTPQYMAPEQFSRDASRIGPWTDLYAVGCIAWELACGRRVFPEGGLTDLMRSHVHARPPAFTPTFSVPADLEAWVLKTLEKASEKRFPYAADAAWTLMGLGDPVDLDRSTMDLGLSEASTFCFQTLAPLTAELNVPEPVSDEAESRSWGHPPMPRDWRAPLVTVRRTGEASALVLYGPPGVGKTRVANWLGLRTSELGSARFYEARYAQAEAGISGLLGREFGQERGQPRVRHPARRRLARPRPAPGDTDWLRPLQGRRPATASQPPRGLVRAAGAAVGGPRRGRDRGPRRRAPGPLPARGRPYRRGGGSAHRCSEAGVHGRGLRPQHAPRRDRGAGAGPARAATR
ncbi:MAG TPA: serine/threonine-protein kinase [Myxococcota bacterium]|nr:serine/threonine-protein kinase [Myxococcota bacterium]